VVGAAVILLAISTNQALWWATIGAGLIVALVVWALLEVLRRTVRDVAGAVDDVWTMGKRVAQNTQVTHLLQTTASLGAELAGELSPRPQPPTAERSSP
jgi:hypothetical protein